MTDTGYAISADGLTKRYGAICAVDNVSLRVGRGEIYAFLGLNGAGKTTTIRMLLGMIRPTSGAAYLLGRPVSADARDLWAQVGYLVETPHAYPELTVRENLEVFRRLRELRDPKAVERIIERLALTAYAERRAGTLSLGNAQRLGLAKALLHDPSLLLLDEPANGLDPAGVVEIRELLRELAHEQRRHDLLVEPPARRGRAYRHPHWGDPPGAAAGGVERGGDGAPAYALAGSGCA